MVTQSGDYTVNVTNSSGCKGSDLISVIVDCKGVYFPTSFTPNGDGLNEEFGPVGDIGALRNFTMSVYNRWGQLVFFTLNPFIKWNGKFKGKEFALESFVWKASYKINGVTIPNQKGMVTIIR